MVSIRLWTTPARQLSTLWITLLVCGCAGTTESDGPPDHLENMWDLYVRKDPGWPEARDRWIASGKEESEILINTLMRDLIANERGRRSEFNADTPWVRALNELDDIGDPVRPYAWTALEVAIEKKDKVARDRCVELLGRIETPQEIATRFEATVDERRRHALIDIASFMVDADSESFLVFVLRDDQDWQSRAKAAEALGRRALLFEERNKAILVAGLADEDLFVARKVCVAAKTLEIGGIEADVMALFERATRARDNTTSEVCVDYLIALTGRFDLGKGLKEWKEYFRGR